MKKSYFAISITIVTMKKSVMFNEQLSQIKNSVKGISKENIHIAISSYVSGGTKTTLENSSVRNINFCAYFVIFLFR